MKITLVAAAGTNNVIGKDNHLLWHLPNDMKFFKNTTWAMPVIMGRKTFESLDGQFLNGRYNIIITHNPASVRVNEHTKVATSLQEAIEAAKETDAREVFVIGGGQIYKESLPVANKIVLTRVQVSLDGDAYFPEFNTNEWKMISHLDFPADEKHQYAYSFQVWERK